MGLQVHLVMVIGGAWCILPHMSLFMDVKNLILRSFSPEDIDGLLCLLGDGPDLLAEVPPREVAPSARVLDLTLLLNRHGYFDKDSWPRLSRAIIEIRSDLREPVERMAPSEDRSYGASSVPSPPRPFVGREADRVRLRDAMLGGARLMTIQGAPGIGKTALARALAWEIHGQLGPKPLMAEIELSGASGVPGFVHAVALGLGLDLSRAQREEIGLHQIGDLLARSAGALLLLDGCEGLSEVIGPVLERWIGRAPGLYILVTSRHTLHVSMEFRYSLGPLPQAEGVALFRQIAVRDVPEFTLPSAKEVDALVGVLEGIPLAIRLVASYATTLSPAEMRRRSAAITRPAFLPAFDRAWLLLSSEERRAVARLSTFPRGFSLSAAEQVLKDPDTGFRTVEALVEKAWLRSLHVPGLGARRFQMLESLRGYASEKMSQYPDHAAIQLVCQEAVLASADGAARDLHTTGWTRGLAALGLELDNLAAILRESSSGSTIALRAALLIDALFDARGPVYDLIAFLDLALRDMGDAPISLRAEALTRRAVAARRLGRFVDARQDVERAMELLADGSHLIRARALLVLATVARIQGERERAVAVLHEAEALLDPTTDVLELARVKGARGNVLTAIGDFHGAATTFREALAAFEAGGDVFGSTETYRNLADILIRMGESDEASRLLQAAAEVWRKAGRHHNEAECLLTFGTLHLHRGVLDQAAQAFAQAERTFGDQGDRLRQRSASAWLALALLEEGRTAEAVQRLHAVSAAADADDNGAQAASTRINLALAHLVRAEHGLALRVIDEATARGAEGELQNLRGYRCGFEALAHLPAGIEAARQALSRARSADLSSDLALAATLEAVTGCVEAAEARIAPPERAPSLLARAQERLTQLTHGDRAPARLFQDARLVSKMLSASLDAFQGAQVVT